jgi:hypothetical protein
VTEHVPTAFDVFADDSQFRERLPRGEGINVDSHEADDATLSSGVSLPEASSGRRVEVHVHMMTFGPDAAAPENEKGKLRSVRELPSP